MLYGRALSPIHGFTQGHFCCFMRDPTLLNKCLHNAHKKPCLGLIPREKAAAARPSPHGGKELVTKLPKNREATAACLLCVRSLC